MLQSQNPLFGSSFDVETKTGRRGGITQSAPAGAADELAESPSHVDAVDQVSSSDGSKTRDEQNTVLSAKIKEQIKKVQARAKENPANFHQAAVVYILGGKGAEITTTHIPAHRAGLAARPSGGCTSGRSTDSGSTCGGGDGSGCPHGRGVAC